MENLILQQAIDLLALVIQLLLPPLIGYVFVRVRQGVEGLVASQPENVQDVIERMARLAVNFIEQTDTAGYITRSSRQKLLEARERADYLLREHGYTDISLDAIETAIESIVYNMNWDYGAEEVKAKTQPVPQPLFSDETGSLEDGV